MPGLQVWPFEPSHVPEAGRCLAERHRRHRAAQPLLSARYEAVDAATAEVSSALAVDGASGSVATRDGRMIGYLLGAPKQGDLWGPNVWVEAAGQAVAEAEVIRDLYAVAATRWFDEGHTAHFALVPASDKDLMRAWFRLSFGHQHAHAIRAVTQPTEDEPAQPSSALASAAGLSIRAAVRADVPVLAQLDIELPRHQMLAPTFSSRKPPTPEESLEDWSQEIDGSEYVIFVAERDGQIIGCAVGCALEKSNAHAGLARPDNAAFLSFAAVFPTARGGGAGRALGEAVLDWAAAQGFASVVIDWRVTNLLASRAWPALGFAETFARLHRLVGY